MKTFKQHIAEGTGVPIDTSRWERVHGKKPEGKSFYGFIANIKPEDWSRKTVLHRRFKFEIRGNYKAVAGQVEALAKRAGVLTTSKKKISGNKAERDLEDYMDTVKTDIIYLVP